jgi:hypothetical protein
MLGKLSIAGAVAAILMIPTPLSAQVGGAAVNPGAAVRGAVIRGIPTPGDLAGSAIRRAGGITVGLDTILRLP